MIRLAFVAAALALGCSGNDSISRHANVSLAPEFSTEQTEASLDAIQNWRDATDGAIALQPGIGSGGDVTIGPGYCGPDCFALTSLLGGHARIIVNPAIVHRGAAEHGLTDAVTWRSVVTHELGHALGLGHAASGLMRASCPGDCGDVDSASAQIAEERAAP